MNKTFGRKLRQGIGILLAAAVVFNMLPLGGLAVSASENSRTGICEHHTEHTADCSYAEAGECRHAHTKECYTAEGEPDCHHEHDEGCGYAKAHECTYVCEICSNEASEEDDVEDSDAEDADLSRCEGEKTENRSEENKEDAEQGDTGAQDAGTKLCAHHKEHTQDCGYSPASEDGEGSPCIYECCICPIKDLIAALPDEVTEDNAKEVRAQLNKILDLYRELTAEEQEQIDLTRCYDLQDQLNVNIPSLILDSVDYRTCDADGKNWTTASCDTYTEVTPDTITWSTGWYAASGSVTISSRVTVNGDVHLILTDGCSLDTQGITVNSGNSLTIYAQTGGTGSLTATASGGAAGIGGSAASIYSGQNGGTIIINGGNITASNSGGRGPGIGGGNTASDVTVIIHGGTVNAIGGSFNPGIGAYNGGTITITGGTVTATHGDNYSKDFNGTPTITGGTVNGTTYGILVTFVTDTAAVTIPEQNIGAGETATCPGDPNGYVLSFFADASYTTPFDFGTAITQSVTIYVKCEVNDNYLVSVTTGGVETKYTGSESFVNAIKGASGEVDVKLLQNVDLGNLTLTIPGGVTLTFSGGEYTLTGSDPQTVAVDGIFNFKGGTLLNTHRFGTAVKVYGSFTMSGGVVDCANNTGAAVMLLASTSRGTITSGIVGVNNGGLDITGGTVVCSGGTYSSIYYRERNVADILTSGYALQGTDGLIRRDTSLSNKLHNVTVVPCTHAGAVKDNGDGTHSVNCLYCNYTETAANCDYGTEYKHDDTNHTQTCKVCGYEKVEAHTLKLAVKANGTVITARDTCDCGYKKDLGTVTLTVPANLAYNDGQTIAWKSSEGLKIYNGAIGAQWDNDDQGLFSGSIPVKYFHSGTMLSAGTHALKITVDVSAGASTPGRYATCTIPVTIVPAKLTEGMVTLPASATYSGAEQKPAITVKQSETKLTEGTDYAVTYSTTDLTNVGTISVTITGKGNYKGTVEKTYTIKKAVLTADGIGIANGTYGAKLSELSVAGLTAISQETGAAVPGNWKLTGSTVPDAGDTGTYTATFTPAAGAENFEPLTAQVTLKIAKAAAPVPQTGTLYVQNNGESYRYDLTQLLPALDNGKSYGIVSYTLGESAVNIPGGYYTDGAEITGTTLTLPIQKVENSNEGKIGTVSITITSRNYADMTAEINVMSVNKSPVTITGVSVAGREYNGEAVSCTGTPGAAESGGGTAAISREDYRYTWKKADGTVLSEVPKNAGSYLLIVSVDNDTYIGSRTISFVIDKAKITITANSMTVDKGGAKPTLSYTISGLAKGDALTTEPTLTCIVDMNTAGRYPITVSGAEVPNTGNYHSEITYVPGTLTVTVRTPGGSGSSGGGNSGGSGNTSDGNDSGSENNENNGSGNTAPKVTGKPSIGTDVNPGMETTPIKSGTGNTVRQGSGTGTGSSAAQETGPETGIPFIKGEDGKIGWNVIRAEEEKAEEGSVIDVDMNGTTVVPGDIFDSIKGRDVTITFDMGSGILWSVDGKSIITDKADDIDFTVKTGGSAVPVEIVNNVTGEYYSIQLSLAHDGEFGFNAVLSVNLGKENAGYIASLYYYNQNAGELEFMCADEVTEDGTVSFAFTHASDYVIVIDKISEEPAPESAGDITEAPAEEDGNSGEAVVSPKEIGKTKGSSMPWLILAGVAVVILGAAGILIWKRKKEEGN